MKCPICNKEVEKKKEGMIDVYFKDKNGHYDEFVGDLYQCKNCLYTFVSAGFSNVNIKTYDYLIDKYSKRII